MLLVADALHLTALLPVGADEDSGTVVSERTHIRRVVRECALHADADLVLGVLVCAAFINTYAVRAPLHLFAAAAVFSVCRVHVSLVAHGVAPCILVHVPAQLQEALVPAREIAGALVGTLSALQGLAGLAAVLVQQN